LIGLVSITFKKLKRRLNPHWLTSFQDNVHDGLVNADATEGKTRGFSLLFISTEAIVSRGVTVLSPVTDMEFVTAAGTAQQARQQRASFAGRSSAGSVGLGSVRGQHALIFQVLLPRDIRGVMVF
jgi:hypothetical protein